MLDGFAGELPFQGWVKRAIHIRVVFGFVSCNDALIGGFALYL